MLIVVDTNVIVSALLNPFGKPAVVLRLVLGEKVTIGIDDRILAEYHEVLRRPRFRFNPSAVDSLLLFIEEIARHISALPCGITLSDEDDLPFVEVALAGGAAYLVTGNTGHFPSKIGATKVVLPARFLECYSNDRLTASFAAR